MVSHVVNVYHLYCLTKFLSPVLKCHLAETSLKIANGVVENESGEHKD